MALRGLREVGTLGGDYVAAIRSPAGEGDVTESWQLTKDVSKVSATPDEHVLFARDMYDLVAQLERLNPAQPGFSYLYSVNCDRDTHIDVSLCPRATTANEERILAAARKFGKVVLQSDVRDKLGIRLEGDRKFIEVDDEFYFDVEQDLLVLDPAKVKRLRSARKSQETSKVRYGVMRLDVLCSMAYHVMYFIGHKRDNLLCGRMGDQWFNGLLRYDGCSARSGRRWVSDHLAEVIKLAATMRVSAALLKDKEYRTWLMQVRPYIAGMRNNKEMSDLAVVLEAQCKKAKLKVPELSVSPPKKKKSATS